MGSALSRRGSENRAAPYRGLGMARGKAAVETPSLPPSQAGLHPEATSVRSALRTAGSLAVQTRCPLFALKIAGSLAVERREGVLDGGNGARIGGQTIEHCPGQPHSVSPSRQSWPHETAMTGGKSRGQKRERRPPGPAKHTVERRHHQRRRYQHFLLPSAACFT